ncbi:MAG: flippase, partial [Actinobacteria bacterium]|nr:flippase [Actinomycetota bacterium]
MNTVQRIAKNSLVLLASNIISNILGFFYVMYIARYLGAEGFGILSFVLAFTGIFSVFSDLGLSPLTVREVARDRSLVGKYLGNITVIKIILVIITFGLIAITINLLGYPKQTIIVVYFLALSVIFSSFSNIFNSIFQAYEKMEYQSIEQILSSILMLSGALFAISHGFSVIGFAFIYFLVRAVALGYSFAVYTWKFSLPKLELDWSFWKPTIKEALPFFLSAVVDIIAFKIDIIMLSMMKGDMVVGWYSAAYRLIEALMFIPATFAGAIYPVLSNFYVSSQESLKLIYKKSFKYLFIVGLPIAVGTTILAHKIILFIYKSGFTHSIIALQILIWTIPIIFLTYMFGTMLASINKQDLTLKILLLSMSLNVVMNLILIPRYSYIGASIATVITELLS